MVHPCHLRSTYFRIASRLLPSQPCSPPFWRLLHTGREKLIDYESKYAEKLQQRAQEAGSSIQELKIRAKEAEREKRATSLQERSTDFAGSSPSTGNSSLLSQKHQSRSINLPSIRTNVRRDGSPVKPLASFINVSRFFSAPHTFSQISTIWTAYHATRSGGTGKGYICASIPTTLYEEMLSVAKKYTSFVLPVPHVISADDQRVQDSISGSHTAHEFFFLQWAFHGSPQPPQMEMDPFAQRAEPQTVSDLPHISTVLFTPLQEYKLRASFATPYLVLTFYPDLASSHDIVLMRGEITPSAAVVPGSKEKDSFDRFLLDQDDAQILAMGLQKFYLWNRTDQDGKVREGKGAEELLKAFHETPDKFEWQELLKHGSMAS